MLLEGAYDDVADDWLQLARTMGDERSASLAHTAAAAGYVSDFGLMLAWSRLAEVWHVEEPSTLLVCDDPWLFRHLKEILPEVSAASPPPALARREAWMFGRGILARTRASVRFFLECLRWRGVRYRYPEKAGSILVYGHPDSDASGKDAYFGNLLQAVPELRRVLHIDTNSTTARALAADDRTFSLHAWGSLTAALSLPFLRWNPQAMVRTGRYRWLVRRAVVHEGSTGQAAAIRWQQVCQEAWLRSARPRVVIWPWENHAWERALSRSARRHGVATIGYQHATVGRQEWNYAPTSNPDPERSLPERILCAGSVFKEALERLGHSPNTLTVVGFLRATTVSLGSFDPAGPVLVALPFDREIASQLLDAIEPLVAEGREFVVKPHPMNDIARSHQGIKVIDGETVAAPKGVRAVLYAATSLGLEAAVAGLPVVRFQAAGKLSQDVIPTSLAIPVATAETLADALNNVSPQRGIRREDVFSKPDIGLWREILAAVG